MRNRQPVAQRYAYFAFLCGSSPVGADIVLYVCAVEMLQARHDSGLYQLAGGGADIKGNVCATRGSAK